MINSKTINKYVTFDLGETKFGIEVLKTREIVEHNKITPVPEAPEYIEGVINLRGSVVPVVDLNKKFFDETSGENVTTSIIIVEPELDGEQTLMGLIVDKVEDVLEIKSESLEPPPKYGAKLKSEYILNVASIENEFIMILDIDKVLSQVEIGSKLNSMISKQKGKNSKEESSEKLKGQKKEEKTEEDLVE